MICAANSKNDDQRSIPTKAHGTRINLFFLIAFRHIRNWFGQESTSQRIQDCQHVDNFLTNRSGYRSQIPGGGRWPRIAAAENAAMTLVLHDLEW